MSLVNMNKVFFEEGSTTIKQSPSAFVPTMLNFFVLDCCERNHFNKDILVVFQVVAVNSSSGTLSYACKSLSQLEL
jgi:hypothetical protein